MGQFMVRCFPNSFIRGLTSKCSGLLISVKSGRDVRALLALLSLLHLSSLSDRSKGGGGTLYKDF